MQRNSLKNKYSVVSIQRKTVSYLMFIKYIEYERKSYLLYLFFMLIYITDINKNYHYIIALPHPDLNCTSLLARQICFILFIF